MNTFSQRMKEISNEKSSPQSDPLFYVFLKRLINPTAEASDKIDARKALDDFIVGESSLRYQKALKEYEKLRAEYIAKHGEAPNDVSQLEISEYIQRQFEQQTPKQLDHNDMSIVREKSRVNKLTSHERKPVPPPPPAVPKTLLAMEPQHTLLGDRLVVEPQRASNPEVTVLKSTVGGGGVGDE